jgi:hypothetical protein
VKYHADCRLLPKASAQHELRPASGSFFWPSSAVFANFALLVILGLAAEFCFLVVVVVFLPSLSSVPFAL